MEMTLTFRTAESAKDALRDYSIHTVVIEVPDSLIRTLAETQISIYLQRELRNNKSSRVLTIGKESMPFKCGTFGPSEVVQLREAIKE